MKIVWEGNCCYARSSDNSEYAKIRLDSVENILGQSEFDVDLYWTDEDNFEVVHHRSTETLAVMKDGVAYTTREEIEKLYKEESKNVD